MRMIVAAIILLAFLVTAYLVVPMAMAAVRRYRRPTEDPWEKKKNDHLGT